MLKRFISYYKPYKFQFILDLLASLLISILSMVYPIVTRKMLNIYIPEKQIDNVIKFGLILLAIYLVNALLSYFVNYYGHYIGMKIIIDMRTELFKKLEKLPFSYFDCEETGRIMARFTSDIFEISELAHHGPELIMMSVVNMGLSFIYLSSINLYLTLIIFLVVPISILVVIKFRKQQREATRLSKKAIATINADLSSSISGIRVTKAFNNNETEINKFTKSNQEFARARKQHFAGFSKTNTITQLVGNIFNVLVLICGGIFLYQGKIQFGDYSAFIVSIGLFITPINQLVSFSEALDEGTAGFERFCQIMDENEEKDYDNANDYPILKGDIEFEDVTFSYDNNGEKEVLENVSFKIKADQTIALVGPSGGGKSTICHLLPRFYEIENGKIYVDNVDSKLITLSSLRNNIGIVQQDVFLFSGSFYENIAYGKANATKQEIYEAAKKANIYDYIMSFEKGFDTQIGERGVLLSGGQKQRLSIARVFLKNPSILILDEATSALDNTTEALIQQSLNSLKQGRTTIVVAHRLSTVKNADTILVVVNGKIVEEGNHQQLLNIPNGVYQQLYQTQFQDRELNVDNTLMNR